MSTLRESTAVLRSVHFRWFFLGRTVSMLGNAMAPIALAFAILDLTGSASDLGLVLAARSVPLAALMLVGGVVADRFSRSTVLTYAHLGAAATQGAVALLLLTGEPELWTILVLEFANGSLSAFTFPAMQGATPQVTPTGMLQQANALMSFSRSGMFVIGPSVAGLLVVTVGSGWTIAYDALSYLVAAYCMSRLRLDPVAGGSSGTMLRDLRVGWSEFVAHTWLWVIVVAFGLLNIIHAGVLFTLGPAIAIDTVGKATWGFFVSAEGVGFLVMSVILLRLKLRFPLRAGMLGCLFLVPPMLVLGISPQALPLVLFGFLAGAGTELFGTGWNTALQEHVPLEALSRVASYDALGSFVAIPVGQVLAGPLASTFGTESVVVTAGAIYGLIVCLTLLSSSVRNLEQGTASAVEVPAERPDG